MRNQIKKEENNQETVDSAQECKEESPRMTDVRQSQRTTEAWDRMTRAGVSGKRWVREIDSMIDSMEKPKGNIKAEMSEKGEIVGNDRKKKTIIKSE